MMASIEEEKREQLRNDIPFYEERRASMTIDPNETVATLKLEIERLHSDAQAAIATLHDSVAKLGDLIALEDGPEFEIDHAMDFCDDATEALNEMYDLLPEDE